MLVFSTCFMFLCHNDFVIHISGLFIMSKFKQPAMEEMCPIHSCFCQCWLNRKENASSMHMCEFHILSGPETDCPYF